jgi:hypothetical protein
MRFTGWGHLLTEKLRAKSLSGSDRFAEPRSGKFDFAGGDTQTLQRALNPFQEAVARLHVAEQEIAYLRRCVRIDLTHRFRPLARYRRSVVRDG